MWRHKGASQFGRKEVLSPGERKVGGWQEKSPEKGAEPAAGSGQRWVMDGCLPTSPHSYVETLAQCLEMGSLRE